MDFEFELRPGTFSDRVVVDRLMELYLYDYSEFDGFDVDEHGMYRYDDLDYYWMEKSREILVFKVNGKWAGFAMISEEVVLDGAQRSLDNFFVMRKYRRQGVGALAARTIFERTPSAWEISVLPNNAPACAFWRRVVNDYTRGTSQETVLDNDDWRGPVLSFDNRS